MIIQNFSILIDLLVFSYVYTIETQEHRTTSFWSDCSSRNDLNNKTYGVYFPIGFRFYILVKQYIFADCKSYYIILIITILTVTSYPYHIVLWIQHNIR